MLKCRAATFLYTQPRVEKKGAAYIPPKLAQALINRTAIIKVKHQLAWVRALVFHMSTSSRPGERPEAEIDEERIQDAGNKNRRDDSRRAIGGCAFLAVHEQVGYVLFFLTSK